MKTFEATAARNKLADLGQKAFGARKRLGAKFDALLLLLHSKIDLWQGQRRILELQADLFKSKARKVWDTVKSKLGIRTFGPFSGP